MCYRPIIALCSVAHGADKDIHRMREKSAFSLELICSTEAMMSKDKEQTEAYGLG